MTIKKIMVPFVEVKSAERAFAAAVPFAKKCSAHIDVVHLRLNAEPPVSAFYPPVTASYAAEQARFMKEASDILSKDLRELFRACAERFDVKLAAADHHDEAGSTAAWREIEGPTFDDLAAHARVCDMVVMARPDSHAPGYDTGVIETVLFGAGRPVLVAGPEGSEGFPERVTIAWDGGREAARAVALSLPVLAEAKDVTVLTVGKLAASREPPESVVAYLRLHGVHATAVKLSPGDSAEDTFQTEAEHRSAQLIVMGAYSHSRLRQLILGGFTRSLLGGSETPLLLSH
ncbi:MAG: universal stress protein [Pseudomonadota bacterium]